jgi:tryptophan synthase alpha chain
MGRIAETFQQLAATGRKGFIPFVTAGDPDVETSKAIIGSLARCGADIIELGVPFSDPMADGPTIQASSMRALEKGVNLANVLELASGLRDEVDVPLVLFSYLNPLHSYGIERLSADAAEAGIDGILVTDVVDDEADALRAVFAADGIDLISLIAPTTSDERLERIAANAAGFIYAVSRAGVTGAARETSSDAEVLVARARRFTDRPVAVGFGISTHEQVADVWRYADAAVVGSAIVSVIADAAGKDAAVESVETFVDGLLGPVAKGRP